MNRDVRSGELKYRPLRAKISLRAMRKSSFESPLRSFDVSNRVSESANRKSDCALADDGAMAAMLRVDGKMFVSGSAVAT